MTLTGQVISSKAGKFSVKTDECEIICSAKGSLKIKGDGICVGDKVEVEGNVIVSVFKRKNRLYRPNVSNVDAAIIVAADLPEPDFYLIDKFISNAYLDGIPCVIAVNKVDISTKTYERILENYSTCVEKIFSVSAKTGEGMDDLLLYLKDKTCVFTGQSAVGKTSIVNYLFNRDYQTGEVSEKTLKGRQTTTSSRIFEERGVKIVDTPGFSALNIDLLKKDIPRSYPDFERFSTHCKFSDCRHIGEPDCAVKKAVDENMIGKDRYSRFLEIYKNAKENKDYGKKN